MTALWNAISVHVCTAELFWSFKHARKFIERANLFVKKLSRGCVSLWTLRIYVIIYWCSVLTDKRRSTVPWHIFGRCRSLVSLQWRHDNVTDGGEEGGAFTSSVDLYQDEWRGVNYTKESEGAAILGSLESSVNGRDDRGPARVVPQTLVLTQGRTKWVSRLVYDARTWFVFLVF